MYQLQQRRPSSRTRRHPNRRHRPCHRHGTFGLSLGNALDITVETFIGLSAQHACRHTLRGDHAGTVTGFFIVLVVDRFHDRMRDIKSRQVEQFEGPKLEAALVGQDAVDGVEVTDTLTDDTERLGPIATPGMVDDESRRVLGLHSAVTHLSCIA